MKLYTLVFRGKEYISLDDLILWLKESQEILDDEEEEEKRIFHFLIRSVVQIKNNKDYTIK